MKIFGLHKNAFNLMRRFHSLDHSMGPIVILDAIAAGLIPYIPIILSASILNSLLVKQYRLAFRYSIIMAVLVCIGGLFLEYLNKVLYIHSSDISKKVESMLYEKPLMVDYESVEDGTVVARFTNALKALRYKGDYGTLLRDYAKLLQNIISFITAVALTIEICISIGKSKYFWLNAVTSPAVSVIIILGVLIIISGGMSRIVKWAQTKVMKLFDLKVDSENRFMYLIRMVRDEDMIKMIQSYNAEELVYRTFKKTSKLIKKNYKKECTYWNIEGDVQSSASALITVLAYAVVTMKVLAQAVSLGSFLKYSQAIIKMNESILDVVSTNQDISEIMIYMNKLMEFLDMKNKFETGSIPVEKRSDHEYKFCFEHVWFKYPNQEEYVLRDINCELNLHEKSALVGPNGAGKSTLIKLLCRLYEPTEGKITLNGTDIRKYDYQEYLSLFSVVFQDFGLFSFSLSENVASSMDYSLDRIKVCLEKSGLEHFEGRLEESVEDEDSIREILSMDKMTKFSGGEQQKIAIARALYKNAPFVILDEPTAALDPLSEYDIYQRFDSLVGDKTCVYISHRMSSCRFCTDIIVLDQGKIVERGNHDALLAEGNLYSEMWNAQAQYYQVS